MSSLSAEESDYESSKYYRKIIYILDYPKDRKTDVKDIIGYLGREDDDIKYPSSVYDRIIVFACTSFIELGDDDPDDYTNDWFFLITDLLETLQEIHVWPSVDALIEIITHFYRLPRERLIGTGATSTKNVVYCMYWATACLNKDETAATLAAIKIFVAALRDYEESGARQAVLDIQHTDLFAESTYPAVQKLFGKLVEYISDDDELASAQLDCVYGICGYAANPYEYYDRHACGTPQDSRYTKSRIDNLIDDYASESGEWICQILSGECARIFSQMHSDEMIRTIQALSQIDPAKPFDVQDYGRFDWVQEWVEAEGAEFVARESKIIDAIILYAFRPLCIYRIGREALLDAFESTVQYFFKTHRYVLGAEAHLQLMFYSEPEEDMLDIVGCINQQIIPILVKVYGSDYKDDWADCFKTKMLKAFTEWKPIGLVGYAAETTLDEFQEYLEDILC